MLKDLPELTQLMFTLLNLLEDISVLKFCLGDIGPIFEVLGELMLFDITSTLTLRASSIN